MRVWLEAGGAIRCRACGFDAALLEDPQNGITSYQCEVCGDAGKLAKLDCGFWCYLDADPGPCACGWEHTPEDLFEQLDATPAPRRPKDALLEGGPPRCGECQAGDVAHLADGSHYCIECGAHYAPGSTECCEYCGVEWVGADLEHSAAFGCSDCPGSVGNALAKDD